MKAQGPTFGERVPAFWERWVENLFAAVAEVQVAIVVPALGPAALAAGALQVAKVAAAFESVQLGVTAEPAFHLVWAVFQVEHLHEVVPPPAYCPKDEYPEHSSH